MAQSSTAVKSKASSYFQPIIGSGLIIAMGLFGGYLNSLSVKLPLYLFAGLILGYTLTRARFGFAGGIKRIYMRGEGSLSKAILVLLFVTALVTMGIQWQAAQNGAVPAYLAAEGASFIPGTTNVYFTNIATIIGGFIFGIGMMLAGGCGSGTLADFGEGSGRALIAFIFFVFGTAPGHFMRQIVDGTAIGKIGIQLHLPQVLGYFGSLLFVGSLLGLLYWIIVKYENKRKLEGTYMDPKGDYEEFEKPLSSDVEAPFFSYETYHKFFIQRWSFVVGALVLAFGALFVLVTTNKNWGVSTALLTWNVAIYENLGIHLPVEYFGSHIEKVQAGLLTDGGTIRNIGLFFGCTISFLLAKRFSFDFSFNKKDAGYFALGGLMLGFGSRFGLGCNIGAMYASISSFSISGWFFLMAMTLGGIVGMKMFAGKVCILPHRIRK
ncbi:YeeE/YedE family protein [Lacticigenium naphthae]|uniref:YeeE/YedE family protein n=1 Tax=Lacticigenium naphthae TaxID=515351 RepID=UPI0004086EE5|nr:YeeE/YedE family protein [Lacticigenium naphthae]